MISFAFAQTIAVRLPHWQVHCANLLLHSKSLSKSKDATAGRTARLVSKGIISGKPLSISARDMVFVIDWEQIHDGGGPREEIDYLLNGRYYRFVSGYKPGKGGDAAWKTYPAKEIAAIAAPRSLTASIGKLVAKPAPAPINAVVVLVGNQAPAPNGFYDTPTDPTPTAPGSFYDTPAPPVPPAPESFYST